MGPMRNEVEFDSKGYTVIRQLAPLELVNVAFRYYLSYVALPGYYNAANRHRSLDRYIDALSEAMFPMVQAKLEEALSRKLLPTYSFARIYTTDSVLEKHVDRGGCEISATMTVGYRNVRGLWPVLVESDGADIPIELDAGDALIYRGMELPHWREQLPQGIWCQVFFHFVDAAGDMTSLAFDGRGRLGPRIAENLASE